MKRIIYLLLLYQSSLWAQEQKIITISDCYKGAREVHPSLSDQARMEQINNLKLSNNKIQWLPQLNLNGQATYQSDAIDISIPMTIPNQSPTVKHIQTDRDQYKATLDINQMLYDGGSVKIQKQMTDISAKTDILQTEVDIFKAKEQVNQIYFFLLIIKQNEKLLQASVNNLSEKRKSLESGVANGLLNQNDLRQIDVEIIKISQQITDLQISYKNNLKILSELTGINTETPVQLAFPDSIIEKTDSIMRPEQLVFESQRKNTELSKELLQTQRIPKLYAFGQLGYGKPGLNMLGNEFNTFYIVGVSLKWNIWDWNKTSHDKQVATIQREMISSKETLFLKNIRIAHTNNLSKIEQLESAIKTDEQILALNNDIVTTNSQRLDNGIITTTDYLNSVNAQTIAEIQSETHKLQLLQAKYDLLILMGR